MAKQAGYNDFITDPDQEARRADLRAFIGPNADVFMKRYDLLRARTVKASGVKAASFRPDFVVLLFFLGPVWLFYRRMWIWAWGLLGVYVILSLFPHAERLGLPIAVGLAVTGRQIYVMWAISRVAKLRATAGHALTASELGAAGGVSPRAGWISGIILVGLAALSLGLIVLATHLNGGVLPQT